MTNNTVFGETPTLRDYLRVVGRRKWVVLQATLLVPTVALTLSLLQPPRFATSADVLLSRQNLAATLNGNPDPYAGVQAERLAQTQAELAASPTVAERALAEAGVSMGSDEFLEHASVEARPNADLLVFRVEAGDPGIAARLATAYAEAFVDYRRELDTAAIVRAREGVTARLAELRSQEQESTPLYAELVDREQQLRTMEALQTSNAQVTRRAEQGEQIQPRPVRNTILAAIIGFLMGVGMAFLANALDTRVRDADEVAEGLGVPLLGHLPPPPRRRKEGHLAILADPHGGQAEAFRILATSVDFANVDIRAQVIVVTSAVEGEGKTTTTANLADALAKAGRRVVVVDLDLRRPFLDVFFDVDRSSGLTDVVVGTASIEDAVKRVALTGHAADDALAHAAESRAVALARFGLENGTNQNENGHADIQAFLDVLPAGSVPPNPAEFLRTKAVGAALSELRTRADIVLIDSPPLLRVGDALALAPNIDAYLFVVRANVVRSPMLADARRLLETARVPALGFVHTGGDARDRYGYGYGYAPQRKRQREQVR